MDQVKAEVVRFAGPQSDWRGPTSAPKPEPGKHIAYLSSDQQNDASREWGTAIAAIGKKIGWKVTIIDGHGSPVGWQEGVNQAIALKLDGIVMVADAASLQAAIKDGQRQGHRRGRHPRGRLAWPAAGPQPVRQHPAGPARHRQGPGRLGHRQFEGTARVVVPSHNEYAIACAKSHATKARIEECPGCKVLEFSNSPIAEAAQRQPRS